MDRESCIGVMHRGGSCIGVMNMVLKFLNI